MFVLFGQNVRTIRLRELCDLTVCDQLRYEPTAVVNKDDHDDDDDEGCYYIVAPVVIPLLQF